MIIQRQGDLSRVRGALGQIDARTQSIRMETDALRAEAASFKQQTLSFQSQLASARQEKDAAAARLRDLVQQAFVLGNELATEVAEGKKLGSLVERMGKASASMNDLLSATDTVQTRFHVLAEAHEAWVSSYLTLVRQKAPQWDQVRDISSYGVEHRKILEFIRMTPPQNAARDAQVNLLDAIGVVTSRAVLLQTELRSIAASPELAAYRRQRKDATAVPDLLALDETIAGLSQSASRMEKLLYTFDRVRNYLASIVPSHWLQVLKIRLHSANVEEAGMTLTEAMRALRSPLVYSNIKSDFAERKYRISELLYWTFAPRRAQREAIIARQWVAEVSGKVDGLELSESFIRQLRAELGDMAREINLLAGAARLAIFQESSAYLQERRRIVSAAASSEKAKTEYCKKTGARILEGTDGPENEDDFIAFTRACR